MIETKAKIIFKEVLSSIEYMHSKGICHRDLKPRNILLTSNEMHAKITDFNVSKCFKRSNGEIIKMSTHTGTMQTEQVSRV